MGTAVWPQIIITAVATLDPGVGGGRAVLRISSIHLVPIQGYTETQKTTAT